MRDTKDHFTGNVKKIMLQNVVAGILTLNNVKIQSDHDRAHGKDPLNYESYLNLLLSAASTHDSKMGFTSKSKLQAYKSKRSYYNLHSSNIDYDSNGEHSNEVLHDIDTECLQDDPQVQEPYNAFQSQLGNSKYNSNGPKMSKQKWISLSEQEQMA